MLKTLKVEEFRKDLRFRHLPVKVNKEELVDLLLVDNKRVIADNLKETLIASRDDDLKKIADLQLEVVLLQNVRIDTGDKSQIPMDLLSELVATQKLISENIRVSNNNSQVQIISTNDTASAISPYYRKNQQYQHSLSK